MLVFIFVREDGLHTDLYKINCRVTPLDNATVRWSMTRVRCWWKPLSSELSAGPPPCRFAGDERSSPVPTIPVRQEAPPNAEGLGSLTPGGVASLPPHPSNTMPPKPGSVRKVFVLEVKMNSY